MFSCKWQLQSTRQSTKQKILPHFSTMNKTGRENSKAWSLSSSNLQYIQKLLLWQTNTNNSLQNCMNYTYYRCVGLDEHSAINIRFLLNNFKWMNEQMNRSWQLGSSWGAGRLWWSRADVGVYSMCSLPENRPQARMAIEKGDCTYKWPV